MPTRWCYPLRAGPSALAETPSDVHRADAGVPRRRRCHPRVPPAQTGPTCTNGAVIHDRALQRVARIRTVKGLDNTALRTYSPKGA
ncbi:hypothetical protein GCM10012284_00640 [Mangrovihabitans endophyticus]|uniref:Uncharacterized protein n=1 Tax=Mangrovihabitans endophyticus TaxID=1751298 RepID=A0A8J3BVF1_9ACTN|nr:hypothetical protein GCM10012284_00640 [Mangrovihabitans endophyticus]